MIKVLDCTLRDGGYINNWNFSRSQVDKITNALCRSNIDIIELGYLDKKRGSKENSTLFNTVSSVDNIIDNLPIKAQMVVMIDLYAFDVHALPKKVDTKIDGIRLAFHKHDIKNALQAARKIINLGYQLFFQPMVTKTYTDKEFLTLIEKIWILLIYINNLNFIMYTNNKILF